MKIAIILNGISRNKKTFYHKIYPNIAREFDVAILETRFAGHAEELATQAVAQKYDVVIAAGGDGTLHQVINGVLKNETGFSPIVGLIPLGTGNDFARTCSLQPNSVEIIRLLKAWQPKPTDVGRVTCVDKDGLTISRYFINVCSLGMGPEVVRRLVKNSRRWGPAITYYVSIVATFLSHRPQEVYYKTASVEWKGNARVIAIANGKSFGHSISIAPDASLDDGIFNSFIAGQLPLWKFLFYLQILKGGKKIMDDRVIYDTASSFNVIASSSCPIEAEGEWIGWLPAKVELLSRGLNFLR